uniref:Odorant receptor n=1 Tax=Galleria mellonella TaxID=7137 RepID=A0A5C0E3G5_GALME|nr:odorant receptor 18 [Galleria mellonella]
MENYGKYGRPMENHDNGRSTRFIEPYHKTFKLISLTLVLSVMYPNTATEKWRLLAIPIVLTSAAPLLLMSANDIYHFWMEGDISNIIRISTIAGPFTGCFLKMILLYVKKDNATQLMDEMNRDYNLINKLPPRYKALAHAEITNSKAYEYGWGTCCAVAVFIFPLRASCMNIYSYLFDEVPKRYMINELTNPFRPPEEKFNSPYFEIMTAYTIYCGVLYFVQFVGYEGLLVSTMNHACLKMHMFCAALEDAFNAEDREERHKLVIDVIREQVRTFWFVETLIETFQVWLIVISGSLIAQICTCMYYVLEGFGFDLRYLVFMSSTILYMYLLCHHAGKIKHVAANVPSLIYSSGWEDIYDQPIRKMVLFMIARWQVTMEIKALDMFVFDTEFFVFIIKTAYSMFTLLKSN